MNDLANLLGVDDQFWQGANCTTTWPDLFFEPASVADAKAVCADCPIRLQCLEFAIKHNEDGVWGGTTQAERQDIRKALKREVVKKAYNYPTRINKRP